jgi:mannosyl-oligosaccharide alpha-1,2-mannosidase
LLGAHYLGIEEYKTFATELMDSCFKLWYHSPTGLSPEVWGWIERQKDGDDGFIKNHLLKQQKKRQYNMDEDEDEEDIPILEDLPPFGHSFPESIDLTSLDKGYQLRPGLIYSINHVTII